jgi:Protein of unknown function (DUF3800)
MIRFYIDESGTGLGDKRNPYFVLAAIAIPAHEWKAVDSQVVTLKRRLVSWAKPEDFEIKGRDLRRGEKFFKSMNWLERAKAIHEVAQVIATLPCKIFAVQVDKRELPEYVASDDMMYRLTLSRLLDELETELELMGQPGMLMLDMRSDLHSSIQDRRIVDSYRDWVASRMGKTQFTELPWFGFSAFYSGLQIADFSAYLIDFVSNEGTTGRGSLELQESFNLFRSQVKLVHIP